MEAKYKGDDVIQLTIDTLMTIYVAGFNHGANEGSSVLIDHGTFDAFHRTIVGESPMLDGVSYDIKDKIKLIKSKKKIK